MECSRINPTVLTLLTRETKSPLQSEKTFKNYQTSQVQKFDMHHLCPIFRWRFRVEALVASCTVRERSAHPGV
jgi:hypothetical protein